MGERKRSRRLGGKEGRREGGRKNINERRGPATTYSLPSHTSDDLLLLNRPHL